MLRTFDPRSVEAGSRVLYVGPSKHGKTTALLYILRALRRRGDMIYVWTNTLQRQLGNVAAHVPPAAISDVSAGFDTVIAGRRLQYVQTINDRLQRHGQPPLECHLVFEDCAYLKEIHDNPGIHFLMMNGRRYCTTHITTQTLKSIGPQDRSNLSHVVIMWHASRTWLQGVYEEYLSELDEQDFWRAVSQLRKYEALVYQPGHVPPLTILRPRPDDKAWLFGHPEWQASMAALLDPEYRTTELRNLGRLFAGGGRRR